MVWLPGFLPTPKNSGTCEPAGFCGEENAVFTWLVRWSRTVWITNPHAVFGAVGAINHSTGAQSKHQLVVEEALRVSQATVSPRDANAAIPLSYFRSIVSQRKKKNKTNIRSQWLQSTNRRPKANSRRKKSREKVLRKTSVLPSEEKREPKLCV